VVVLLGGAGYFFRAHRAQALTKTDSLVLTDFVNTTGDPVFDGTLKQALAVQLEQSPYLHLVPESRIQEALRYMGRKPDERITTDVGREICLRENVKAMLTGSIASLGNHYVVALGAVNAQTGDSLAREQVEVDSKEQVLKALDKTASSLRQKLGESLASVQQFATPLEQATTTSLEALQAYSLGQAAHLRLQDPDAIPHLQRAIELDPNFAMAYATLGVAYGNTGQLERGSHFLKRAFDLKDRASEREKMYIASHYYGEVTGEIDKTAAIYEQWHQTYPRDTPPVDNLSLLYNSTGQYEKGRAAASEAMLLDPKDRYSYQNLADSYLGLNRLEEARAIADQAVAQKLDSIGIHRILFDLAFLRGDPAGMERALAPGMGGPEEAQYLAFKVAAESARGQTKAAYETWREAESAANRSGNLEFAAFLKAVRAIREAVYGDCASARSFAAESLQQMPDGINREAAARTYAVCGDSQAQKLMAEESRKYPSDTFTQAVIAPVVEAYAAMHAGNPAAGLAKLEAARPYELGSERGNPAFWAIMARGLIYLQMKDSPKAAAEFSRILDHRTIFPESEMIPLAQLNLGRAYASAGETAKAKTAYQDFFALWKDADPDIPVLQQAKAEYAKLQ
jgi:tetratricopeptide (TPR) repeat protein